jgi:YVTN family beta-propeller protein
LALLLLAALGCVSAAAQSVAYVPTHKSNSVAVVNTATNSVIDIIPVGIQPLSGAMSPNGQEVYVTNSGWIFGSNSVSVINTLTNAVVATIPVGNFPIGVAFTPNGDFTYVVNSNANSVSVIDTATRTPSFPRSMWELALGA